MEKEILIGYINAGLSIGEISKLVSKGKTTVRYWLEKYELKTDKLSFKDKGVIDYGNSRCCIKCNKDKPLSEFYQRRGKEGGSVYCKKCTSEQTLERQRLFKQQVIEYKGGECVKCGYNKYQGALEFHHLDPTQKDFNISQVKGNTINDKIKNELDKCILVCSNCHREIHGKI
jgi:Zn ribbon nucleic-acid-binding protein